MYVSVSYFSPLVQSTRKHANRTGNQTPCHPWSVACGSGHPVMKESDLDERDTELEPYTGHRVIPGKVACGTGHPVMEDSDQNELDTELEPYRTEPYRLFPEGTRTEPKWLYLE